MIKQNYFVTAISMMAVIFIAVFFSGCVTSRQIDELKAEHREIKNQITESGNKVDKMEQLITENADASKKLRNDISSSNDQIQEQIDALLENYNELLRMLQQISTELHTKRIVVGSVGGGTVEQLPSTNKEVTSPPQEVVVKPTVDCGKLYDDSFVLFRTGENYEGAIKSFNNFIEKCPDNTSVENAHYWIGECYYALEKYVDAAEKFDYLLKNYKSTVNASRAMYKLARCKQELGKKKEAKKIFQKLIDEYPESFEGSQAKDLIKDL